VREFLCRVDDRQVMLEPDLDLATADLGWTPITYSSADGWTLGVWVYQWDWNHLEWVGTPRDGSISGAEFPEWLREWKPRDEGVFGL
jgi:hypothetical protein